MSCMSGRLSHGLLFRAVERIVKYSSVNEHTRRNCANRPASVNGDLLEYVSVNTAVIVFFFRPRFDVYPVCTVSAPRSRLG